MASSIDWLPPASTCVTWAISPVKYLPLITLTRRSATWPPSYASRTPSPTASITLGVLAGIQRIDSTAGLLYFDGDADLNAPVQTRSGILDATGIAHVLGIADTELGHLDGKSPMLEDYHLVMLGYDETDPDSFNAKVFEQRPSLRRFADHVLRADPTGTAHQALNALSAAAGSIVVHFDVDAVNSGDLPLANFPHYGTGVDLTVAARVLSIL